MSTRRRTEGSAPASNGYMSSPVYAAARGIGGTEATAKASMLLSARCRCLIFFLQALSWRKGGLRKVAADVLAQFPERIGTPAMQRLGVKPGKVYSEKDARQINAELASGFGFLGYARGEVECQDLWTGEMCEPEPVPREERTAEHFLALCRRRVAELETLLVELCVDPLVEFNAPEIETADMDRESLLNANPDLKLSQFRPAGLTWFHDIIGTLFDFQAAHARQVRTALADTAVADKVCTALARALRHRRMARIIGESGIGKSACMENWCEAHLGEIRLITLPGIVEQTAFFHLMAESLGVASGLSQSVPKMKARVLSMLRNSGLALAIDECQYLFAGHERIRSRPPLLDWIYTACVNNGVPVILSGTPHFTNWLAMAEAQSIGEKGLWNSKQFRRRCRDCLNLPATVPPKDALKVVVKLWPQATPGMAAQIVVWATSGKIAQQYPLSWINDLIDDARMIAEDDGRKVIIARDVERAFKEQREPSDLADVESQATAARLVKGRGKKRAAATPLQPSFSGPDNEPPDTEVEEDFESQSRIGSRVRTEEAAGVLTTG